MLDALRDPADELLTALADIALIASDEEAFTAHMKSLGWDATSIPPPFQALAVAGQRVIEALSVEDFEDQAVLGLLEAVVRVVDAVNKLQTAAQAAFPSPAASPAFWANIAREFLDSIIVDHLVSRRPTTAAALKLFGLVRETDVPAVGPRLAYVKREVLWNEIGQLISDPKNAFKQAFDWSGAPKLPEVLDTLATLMCGVGLEPRLRLLENNLAAFLKAGALAANDAENAALDLQWQPSMDDREPGADFGVKIYLRPATSSRAAGISVLPYARFSGADEVALSERLSLKLKGQADLTKGLAITFVPGNAVLFESGFLGGSALPPAEALIGLKLKPEETGEIRLFGAPDASRFVIGGFALSAGAKSGNGGAVEALVELALDNAKLVVKPGPNEADSFLASFLPRDGLAATFSMTIRYSSVTGFHLGGSGGLEATFPSNIQLGPIDLKSVTLALRAQGRELPLTAGATIGAKLGPLSGVVENVGVKLTASFPDPPQGNLGPLNLALGFKAPSGVGLSLDLSVIKGGGYLFFDHEKGEYAGALEFTLIDYISVKAIGIINTKLPDGSKGFSLLMVLTAEFNPGLQLSFGFTLIGVGGIVGLNRAMRFGPILEGVKTGAINGVMFPRDVVANAPAILSNLRAFFPPQRDTFLIGPMVKIGWGTPTLISVSMAVVIEVPGNILLMGLMRMVLPDKDAPIIEINVSFAGGIDFSNKSIFFSAAMFDSRVLAMTLEGGMGFYICYGDEPVFVLTVGGFHPRFAPPAMPIPVPNRLSISVLGTALARIRLEAYFALTSNTAQFGARAELRFKLSECEVQGNLGFDALFQFSPFYLIAEVSGSVSLKVFGMGLFSIRLNFTLEGMTPWRARGRGSISFLFFDVSANFDITWGDAVSAIERVVAVLPILLEELRKAENWRQTLPPGANLLVTLRGVEAGAGDLVMHPLGALTFSQRAVPLEKALAKIGEQRPNDVNKLRVRPSGAELKVLDTPLEQFAPAQFEDMDAAAKLARKSYEPMPSGVSLATDGAQYVSPSAAKRRVRYEEEIIDFNYKRHRRPFGRPFARMFDVFLAGSALSKSPLSAYSKSLKQPFADVVELKRARYAVVRQSDNTPVGANAVFGSEAEAYDHLSAMSSAERAQAHVAPAWDLAA